MAETPFGQQEALRHPVVQELLMASCRRHLVTNLSPSPPAVSYHYVDKKLATGPHVSTRKEASLRDILLTCNKNRAVLQQEQIHQGS